MKTTLEIDDDLYRETKTLAALSGRKMKDIVSEGLVLVLQQKHKPYRQRNDSSKTVMQSRAQYAPQSQEMQDQIENWLNGWSCTAIDHKTGTVREISGKSVLQKNDFSLKGTMTDSSNPPIVGLLAKELEEKSVEEWMEELRGTTEFHNE